MGTIRPRSIVTIDKEKEAAIGMDDMAFRHFEDFSVGEEIDLGTYDLTRADIVEIASTYDPQPFHLDEEAAASSMLGIFCASGWHGCAILIRLLVDGLLHNTASMGAGRVDSVRWLRPVTPGRLTASLQVNETRASRTRPEMGIVHCRLLLCNEAGDVLTEMKTPVLQRRKGAS